MSDMQHRLDAIGASMTALSGGSGINTGCLSKFFSGAASPSFEHRQRIERGLMDLQMMSDACGPIPIDYGAVSRVRQCIAGIRDSTLDISVHQTTPPEKLRAFAVQFCGNGRFYRRSERGEIVGMLNINQADAMTEEIADRVIEKLVGM